MDRPVDTGDHGTCHSFQLVHLPPRQQHNDNRTAGCDWQQQHHTTGTGSYDDPRQGTNTGPQRPAPLRSQHCNAMNSPGPGTKCTGSYGIMSPALSTTAAVQPMYGRSDPQPPCGGAAGVGHHAGTGTAPAEPSSSSSMGSWLQYLPAKTASVPSGTTGGVGPDGCDDENHRPLSRQSKRGREDYWSGTSSYTGDGAKKNGGGPAEVNFAEGDLAAAIRGTNPKKVQQQTSSRSYNNGSSTVVAPATGTTTTPSTHRAQEEKKKEKDAFSRLYHEESFRRERHEAQRDQAQRKEMEGATFRPLINSPRHHTGPPGADHNPRQRTGTVTPTCSGTLNQQEGPVEESLWEWEQRRQQKADSRRKAMRDEEERQLTFAPTLNQHSVAVANVEHYDPERKGTVPVEERLLSYGEKACVRREGLRCSSPTVGGDHQSNSHPGSSSRSLLQNHSGAWSSTSIDHDVNSSRRVLMAPREVGQVSERLYRQDLQRRQTDGELRRAQAEKERMTACPFTPQITNRTKALVGECIPVMPETNCHEVSGEAPTATATGTPRRRGLHNRAAAKVPVHERLCQEGTRAAREREARQEKAERQWRDQANIGKHIGIGPYTELLASLHPRSPLASSRNTSRTSSVGPEKENANVDSRSTGMSRKKRPRSMTPTAAVHQPKGQGNANALTPSKKTHVPAAGGPSGGASASKCSSTVYERLLEKQHRRDCSVERRRRVREEEESAALRSTPLSTTPRGINNTPTSVRGSPCSRRGKCIVGGGGNNRCTSSSSFYERQKQWSSVRESTLERMRAEQQQHQEAEDNVQCTFSPQGQGRAVRTPTKKKQGLSAGTSSARCRSPLTGSHRFPSKTSSTGTGNRPSPGAGRGYADYHSHRIQQQCHNNSNMKYKDGDSVVIPAPTASVLLEDEHSNATRDLPMGVGVGPLVSPPRHPNQQTSTCTSMSIRDLLSEERKMMSHPNANPAWKPCMSPNTRETQY